MISRFICSTSDELLLFSQFYRLLHKEELILFYWKTPVFALLANEAEIKGLHISCLQISALLHFV